MSQNILITGSHGVGKSTAALVCAAQIKKARPELSVVVMEELVREVAHKTGGVNNSKFQTCAMLTHALRFNELTERHDVVICDRACLDFMLYGEYFGVEMESWQAHLANSQMIQFDQIILVYSEEDNIVNDGFRMTDFKQRQEIQQKFMNYLFVTKCSKSDQVMGTKFTTPVNSNDIHTFDYTKLIK